MSSKFLWVPPSSGTRHTGTRQEGNLTTQGTRGELAQKCRGLRRPRSNVRFVWHARPILFPTASSLLRQMHVMKLHTWPAMLVRQQATARLGTSTSRKPRGKLGNTEHWMLSVWSSDIDLHIYETCPQLRLESPVARRASCGGGELATKSSTAHSSAPFFLSSSHFP